jgi:hypothetical protein
MSAAAIRDSVPMHHHCLPPPVSGVSATAIASGGSHSCVIVNGGDVKCWGDNSKGQLGNWTIIMLTDPVDALLGSGLCGLCNDCINLFEGGCLGRGYDWECNKWKY